MKILICGNYGATNIGDEAILAGILELLKKHKPDFQIKALSFNPESTRHLHKVESNYFLPFGVRSFLRGIFGGQIFKTIKSIKQSDVFVLGGGGLFSNESFRAPLIWGMHAFAAKILGKPVIIIGQSVDEISSKLMRWVTRKVFEKAQKISVRDEVSIKILEKMLIKNALLTADPAWILQEKFKETTPDETEKTVIISLREYKRKNPKTILEMAKFAENLHQKGYHCIFTAFQKIRSFDLELIDKITKILKDRSIPFSVFSPNSPHTMLRHMRRATALVGMRLHSNIFASMAEIPFISISYSDKVTSFVKKMQMEDFYINSQELDSALLLEKFESLEQNRSEIVEKIKKSGKNEFDSAMKNLEIFA
jgi:polysaccharide pyruvyl transferase CsaB